MAAEWLTAIGTLALAVLAAFQDTVRGWLYHPALDASIRTQPPDCVAVPITTLDGRKIADALYLRIWVENNGSTTARNVEVYASELLRKRADNTWEPVHEFPPMNLRWSNTQVIYFPNIVPEMGKHCDLGHITDPALRSDPNLREENPRLNLTPQETSLAFDLMAAPNFKGHIIGPGDYRLKILIAAENSRHRIARTVSLSLNGRWFADETRMLREGVGVSITP